jgi:hypothetical protein
MASQDHPDLEAHRKLLRWRLFWFFAGAGVNYLLISTPFRYLRTHTDLSDWTISACSVGASTSLLFLWNYFVNFRTSLRKREALPRYLTAVVSMWLLSSITLSLLKRYFPGLGVNPFGYAVDLDIVATQALIAGLKFPLYHKWAFPAPKPGAGSNQAEDPGGSETAFRQC